MISSAGEACLIEIDHFDINLMQDEVVVEVDATGEVVCLVASASVCAQESVDLSSKGDKRMNAFTLYPQHSPETT